MQTWEQIALGAMMILLMFWMFPKIPALLKQSNEAPKDWMGLLVPISIVVLFVIFLISQV